MGATCFHVLYQRHMTSYAVQIIDYATAELEIFIFPNCNSADEFLAGNKAIDNHVDGYVFPVDKEGQAYILNSGINYQFIDEMPEVTEVEAVVPAELSYELAYSY